MNEVPSPSSMIVEAATANISLSPNPVVVNSATAATTGTKRVEFNFVPSMMMFDDDEDEDEDEDAHGDHMHAQYHATNNRGKLADGASLAAITEETNHSHDDTTNGTAAISGATGASRAAVGGGGVGGAVLWDTETGTCVVQYYYLP
jgi:hypothetical protein